MRTLKCVQWRFLSLTCLLLLITGCGSDDDSQPISGENNFTVTSTDINCSTSTPSVLAPFAGKTYQLSVSASEDISWSVVVESESDFITVTPLGEQQGDGTIKIMVAANPNRTPGNKATVKIENSIAGEYMRIAIEQKEKEVYLSDEIKAGFSNPTSQWNKTCCRESDNIALLWDRALGLDPKSFSDVNKRFDPDVVLQKAEEVYNFLIDDLGFSNRTSSLSNRYKLKIWVDKENQGTAWGGGTHGGEIWLGPNHVKGTSEDRYGIFYHEMCHSFQFMVNQDDKTKGLSGSIGEMTSQYALLRKFPNWMDLEKSHIEAFLKNSHKAFLHEDNQYHSPYVLEYWGQKHGDKIVSRVWKEADRMKSEDAVMSYQRITGITQEQFNDEIYDAATKFVTWDLPRIEKESKPWANKHVCKLQTVGGSTSKFQITKESCPQNYGYNAIGLEVPAAGTNIQLIFTGMASSPDYNIVNPDRRGWRYGFLAVKKDGTREYGEMAKLPSGTLSYSVPQNTQYLWLVVSGAPTKHWVHQNTDGKNDEQWPYQITLLGTTLKSEFIK